MNKPDAAELVVRICRLGWQRGFLIGTDGNISLKLGAEGPVLVTPSGRSKALIQPDDLIEVDLAGEKISGTGKPSSELGLHLLCYSLRPEINAVAHAHPPLATALTASGTELDLSGLPEALLNLGRVPVAPYASPGILGGDELVRSVEPFIAGHNALLMAHHGSLAFAPSLEKAWALTEKLESAAQVFIAARGLGGINPLPGAEQERLRGFLRPSGGEQAALAPLAERVEIVRLALSDEYLTEKRSANELGQAHYILDGAPLKRAAVLEIKKHGGFRGQHIHRLKTEWLYVLRGRLEVQLACEATGERLDFVLEPGDRLMTPPGIAHRVRALEDSEMVELCDRAFSPEDNQPFLFEE